MLTRSEKKVKRFNKISIGLSSTEIITENSHGEVTKPETINYRTFKPDKDGLFCEKIFGPVKDWECHCGKYKGIRYKGIVCDRCGVEINQKSVRRERMGHIALCVEEKEWGISHCVFLLFTFGISGLFLLKLVTFLEFPIKNWKE